MRSPTSRSSADHGAVCRLAHLFDLLDHLLSLGHVRLGWAVMRRRRSFVRTGVALATSVAALACSGGGSDGSGGAAGSPSSTTVSPAEDAVYPGAEWDHADA